MLFIPICEEKILEREWEDGERFSMLETVSSIFK